MASDRVGVIGGGLGGLAAACTLAARGLRGRRSSRRTPGSAARRRCSSEARLPLRHGADHPDPAVGPAPHLRRGRPRPGRRAGPRPRSTRSGGASSTDGSTLDLVAERRRHGRATSTRSPPARPGAGYRDFLDLSERCTTSPTASSSGSRSARSGDMFDLKIELSASTAARRAEHAHGQHRRRARSGSHVPDAARRADARPLHASMSARRPSRRRPCSAASPTCRRRRASGTRWAAPAPCRGAGEAGRRAGRRVPHRAPASPHLDRRAAGAVTGVRDRRRRDGRAGGRRVQRGLPSARTANCSAASRAARVRAPPRLRAGLLGRRALSRAGPRLRPSGASRLRLLARPARGVRLSSTARASRPPTRPATSRARPRPSPALRRPAARRSTCWSTRRTCGRTTTGSRMLPGYRRRDPRQAGDDRRHDGHREPHRVRALR